MIDIHAIVGAITGSRVKITEHADEEARADQVSIEQVLNSMANGEIIEQYMDDKPYPSCLVYSDGDGPLHSVWAYNQANSWAVLITVYRPDPQRWIDWRRRKPKP